MSKKLLLGLAILVALSLLGTPAVAQGATCADDYTVQAADWLSKLADRYFGTILAYPAIVDATNAAAKTDDSYTKIVNPDEIEIGQKLRIPSAEEAEA
ncbi:MAG: LysM peptidoglycan-binding domain-containing protein, partial [Anaerolineae bacterium]